MLNSYTMSYLELCQMLYVRQNHEMVLVSRSVDHMNNILSTEKLVVQSQSFNYVCY